MEPSAAGADPHVAPKIVPSDTASPKNIVLFSDGTGNSASKPFKTNVWRTYQALDLEAPNGGQPLQIAFYRDGVGTETFKPLALLGGIFGLGVRRDVKALYTFLCRNYRDGDRIYAFGFSRGAFTIRLLIGLVTRCGLVQADDENELYHRVNAAIDAFNHEFLYRASRQRHLFYSRLLRAPSYDEGGGLALQIPVARPAIEFLGLWDTVDAYGMPIEELKQGIDRWIWPMSLADRHLSGIVRKACHALSLDDERPTFRPVLWDERHDPDPSRLEQVWFAGVHANVGGGYPIDDLAFIPLVWMFEQAAAAGLRFDPGQVAYFRFMRNIHGTAYDSRSGVAGYYRYGPRSLKKLCDDKNNRVWIDDIRIHESAVERIARRHRSYAPISLPGDLELRHPDTGALVRQSQDFLDLAWDTVFWRRIAYFMTLFLTVFVVLAPQLVDLSGTGPSPCATAVPSESWFANALPDSVAKLIAKLFGFLPAWSAPYLKAAEAHPIVASVSVGVLGWLFFSESGTLQRNISERGEWAWAALKGNTNAKPQTPPWTDRLVRSIRLSPAANGFGAFYDQTLVPLVFAVLVVAVGTCLAWYVVKLAAFFGRLVIDTILCIAGFA